MAFYNLPYGKTTLKFELPDTLQVDVLNPTPCSAIRNLDQTIRQAIDYPLAALSLNALPHAQSIAIAINDKTRPVPNELLLPPLLSKLESLGYSQEQITFYIASGTHVPMSQEEFESILPQEIIQRYNIVAHDCDHSTFVQLGITTRQTPIEINADYFRADIKIMLGNIEPHHFMGYSGGFKSAAIGLASRTTINKNHAMLTNPNARSGLFESNPMRQDVEEIGRRIGIQYALNVILNQSKEIVQILFGEPYAVMQEAIPFVNKLYQVQIEHACDLVIVSPGGHPKDINLYQAQKGITHAAAITKDQGWVILLAACPEGPGSVGYETYIHDKPSHQAVLDDFHPTEFSVGPHKAFQIARDAVRVNLLIVSDMPEERVRKLLLNPCTPDQLDSQLNKILASLPENPKIALLPMGTSTIPRIKIH